MIPDLLPTKLHPPAAPPKGIHRARLTERLNNLAYFERTLLPVLDDFQATKKRPFWPSRSAWYSASPLSCIWSSSPTKTAGCRWPGCAEVPRFTPAAVADNLAHTMGLDLNPEDLARLDVRIEGWVASLRWRPWRCRGRSPSKCLTGRVSNRMWCIWTIRKQECRRRVLK